MLAALWVSRTGLGAQDVALTTISNNLANVSTIGFKKDRAVFQDLLYQIQRQPGAQESSETQLPSGLQLGSGVRAVGTQKVFTPGSLQVTDNALDVAINGRGFLQILQSDGSLGYTRDGQFHIDANGQIVTASGDPLQPALTIPDGAQSVTIGSDGIVTVALSGEVDVTQIGNIQLVDFVNPAGLQSKGGNIYLETAASGNPQEGTPGLNGLGTTIQGSLEISNVSVVEELVSMIATQRAYEMNSKVVSTADQMLQFVSQNL
ncbi:MAG: flagellar basal-body rod protein FlgG [Pseudomonadales bacterium]|nr:flagellar basal-body rod protein FlgG [Pseudomonadales bacterium]